MIRAYRIGGVGGHYFPSLQGFSNSHPLLLVPCAKCENQGIRKKGRTHHITEVSQLGGSIVRSMYCRLICMGIDLSYQLVSTHNNPDVLNERITTYQNDPLPSLSYIIFTRLDLHTKFFQQNGNVGYESSKTWARHFMCWSESIIMS